MMQVNEIKKILDGVLTDGEIRFYTQNLEAPATIQEIAKKTKLNRSGCYTIAVNLIARGLIAEKIIKGRRLFVAEHPRKLVQLLGSQQRTLRRKELRMVDLLPELLSVYDTGTAKPHVKFFEGKDAYQTVAEDALTIQEEPKELLTFINTDTFYSIMDDEYEYEYFIPERIRRKTFAKGLVKETKQSKEQVKNNKQLFRETKFLPTNFDLDLTAYIYENKVALFTSEKELSVLLIESKETYTFFKSLFYTIWNSSIE